MGRCYNFVLFAVRARRSSASRTAVYAQMPLQDKKLML
jgi:hypothetical protein